MESSFQRRGRRFRPKLSPADVDAVTTATARSSADGDDNASSLASPPTPGTTGHAAETAALAKRGIGGSGPGPSSATGIPASLVPRASSTTGGGTRRALNPKP